MPATPGYNQETQEVVYEWLTLKSSDKIKAAIEKKGVAWLKKNFSSIDDLYQVAGGRGSHPATGEDFFCPLLPGMPAVQQLMMSLMTVLNKHKLLLPLLTQQGVEEGELDIFLELLEEFQRFYKSYDPAVVVELEKQLQAQELQYDRKQVKGLQKTIEQIQQYREELRKREGAADKAFALKMGQGDVELRDTNTKIKKETSETLLDEEEWVKVDSPVSTGRSSPEVQRELLEFKAQLKPDQFHQLLENFGKSDKLNNGIIKEFCQDFFEKYDAQFSQKFFGVLRQPKWQESRLALQRPRCAPGEIQAIYKKILAHARDSEPNSRTNKVIKSMQSEAENALQAKGAAPSENAASEASSGPRPGRP